MKKMQSGFTLIELIAVIVILGILAATAVPRFISLQDEAEAAAVQGIKGGFESASALNLAAYHADQAGLTATNKHTATQTLDCSAVYASLMDTALEAQYVITGTIGAVADPIVTSACTIGFDDGAGAVDAGRASATAQIHALD